MHALSSFIQYIQFEKRFSTHTVEAYESDLITEETARLFATRKGRITRGIDLMQKVRGAGTELDSGLRLDIETPAFR